MGIDCQVQPAGQPRATVSSSNWASLGAVLSLDRMLLIICILACFVVLDFCVGLTASMEEFVLVLIVLMLSGLLWGYQSTLAEQYRGQATLGDASVGMQTSVCQVAGRKQPPEGAALATSHMGESRANIRVAQWQQSADLLRFSGRRETNMDTDQTALNPQCERLAQCRPSPLSIPPARESIEVGEPADEKENNGRNLVREATRLRQVMITKAQPEYQRYIMEVPLDERGPEQPMTPDVISLPKRQFNRALSEWRRQLLEFDTAQSFCDNGTLTQNTAAEPVLDKTQSLAQYPEANSQMHTARKQQHTVQAHAEKVSEAFHVVHRQCGSNERQTGNPGVIQLQLEAQLFGSQSPVRLLTLADKLSDSKVVADTKVVSDNLLEPMMLQHNNWLGPQHPKDMTSQVPVLHDKKAFPKTIAVAANGGIVICPPPGLTPMSDASCRKHHRLMNRKLYQPTTVWAAA